MLQVVELRRNAFQVADAVAVAVSKAPRINFIKHRVIEPLVPRGVLRPFRLRAGVLLLSRRGRIAFLLLFRAAPRRQSTHSDHQYPREDKDLRHRSLVTGQIERKSKTNGSNYKAIHP